jgi:hypothetical protein
MIAWFFNIFLICIQTTIDSASLERILLRPGNRQTPSSLEGGFFVVALPKSLSKLFIDSLQCGATTVLLPGHTESHRPFQDDRRIFYSADLQIMILSPEGWTITAGEKTDAGSKTPEAEPDQELKSDIRQPWPDDGILPETGSQRMRSISVLLNKETLFRPTITLVLGHIGDVNFMDYFHRRVNSLRQAGIQVVDHYIDENFRIVTLQLAQTTARGVRLFGLQKYFLRKGMVYNITVSDLNPEYMEKEPKLMRDITQVIQSFAFVEFTR